MYCSAVSVPNVVGQCNFFYSIDHSLLLEIFHNKFDNSFSSTKVRQKGLAEGSIHFDGIFLFSSFLFICFGMDFLWFLEMHEFLNYNTREGKNSLILRNCKVTWN